jgi:hypothetical protein
MIRVVSNTNMSTKYTVFSHAKVYPIIHHLVSIPLLSPTPRNAVPERLSNTPTNLILREIRSLRTHHLGFF